MRKLSKRSVLLFSAVAAVCAFAMPSMASAASWGVIGTAHTLDSTNLAFNVIAVGGGSSCASSQFHIDVRNAAQLTVTSAFFKNCVGTGGAAGCTATPTATRLHWTVTGLAENDVRIDGVHVDIAFHGGACPAPFNNTTVTLTGTLGIGATTPGQTTWDAVAHQLTLENTEGLIAHIPGLGSAPATVTGTIRDTSQSLTLT